MRPEGGCSRKAAISARFEAIVISLAVSGFLLLRTALALPPRTASTSLPSAQAIAGAAPPLPIAGAHTGTRLQQQANDVRFFALCSSAELPERLR